MPGGAAAGPRVTQTVRMWSRVRDWFIGAFVMLVLLVVALAVGWWLLTSPAGSGDGASPTSGEADPAPAADAPAPPEDLQDDEVWLADLELGTGTVVFPLSTLQDVEAQGQGLRSGTDRLVADWLVVHGTVPFSEVAAELGGDTQVGATQDGRAVVRRTVEALGRELPVEATGHVDVRDGLLVVTPVSVDLGGSGLLAVGIAAVVREMVTIEHAIDGLPENLVLMDVQVQEDGFRAHLEGEDVVLVPGALTE